MKNLVEYIARSLVSEPDEVEVTEIDDGATLELRVADDDRGKVIGRKVYGGQTTHLPLSVNSAGVDMVKLRAIRSR